MKRTESRIIQAYPTYENDMIKEMERFGWSLQGRQEMRIEGDTSPDVSIPALITDAIGKTQTYKTEVERYVKLHFVRSLDLPNLDRVREIESEYFNLPFPSGPPPLPPINWFDFFGSDKDWLGSVCLMGIGATIIMMGLLPQEEAWVGFLVGVPVASVGYLWFRHESNKRKRRNSEIEKEKENAIKIREESARRAEELLAELKALGYS